MRIDLRNHKNLIACVFLLNILLFTLLLSSVKCLYNSGDDVFLLYILGGGWGEASSQLLYYNYGMHPYIGGILKTLFTLQPGINWYTILLLSTHFFSCCIVSHQLIKKENQGTQTFVYVSFFLLVESYFLTHLTFTNTAVVTGFAAVLLLFYNDGTNYIKTSIAACLLLVLASMFRLHVLLLVLAVFAPFWFVSKMKVYSIITILIASFLIICLNAVQVNYYKKNIVGWEKQENYRNAFFNYVNHRNAVPLSSTALNQYSLEIQLLNSCFLADHKFLSAIKIDSLNGYVQSENNFTVIKGGEWLNFLVDKRVPKMGTFLILLLLFFEVDKRQRWILALGAIMVAAVLLFLFVFLKIPDYIVYTLTGALILLSAKLKKNSLSASTEKKWPWVFCIILVLTTFNLRKIAVENNANYSKWKNFYYDVAENKQDLFVAADDNFPRDYFGIWDAPVNFKITNVLLKDHFLNNTQGNIIKRFGFTDEKEIFKPAKVYYTGDDFALLSKYLQQVQKDSLRLVLPVKTFRYIKCRQLKAGSSAQ